MLSSPMLSSPIVRAGALVRVLFSRRECSAHSCRMLSPGSEGASGDSALTAASALDARAPSTSSWQRVSSNSSPIVRAGAVVRVIFSRCESSAYSRCISAPSSEGASSAGSALSAMSALDARERSLSSWRK